MADYDGGSGEGMAAEGDYQEEDVWAMMKSSREAAAASNSISISKPIKNFSATSIPRSATSSSGASSAPQRIPDWSKILKQKKNPKIKYTWNDDDAYGGAGRMNAAEDDGDGDEEEEMVPRLPPHEYLARRLASTQIASFSMCEGGVGRTLKGRDLSNLRNAILTKTGFLE